MIVGRWTNGAGRGTGAASDYIRRGRRATQGNTSIAGAALHTRAVLDAKGKKTAGLQYARSASQSFTKAGGGGVEGVLTLPHTLVLSFLWQRKPLP